MSTIKGTNFTNASNSGTANLVLDNTGKVSIAEKKLYCPGTIIQVQNTTFTGVADISLSSVGTYYKITQIAVTITPTAASSKFLITAVWGGEANYSEHGLRFKLIRTVSGSDTDIGIGDAASNRMRCMGVMQPGYHGDDNLSTPTHTTIPHFLDSPNTTNAVTYNVGLECESASKTFSLNSTVESTDAAAYERQCSWMTVQEVAG